MSYTAPPHHLSFLFACLMAFPLCQLAVSFADLDQSERQLRFTLPPSYETDPDAGVFAYTEALPVTQWGPSSRYKATIKVTRYYGTHQERSQQMAVGLMPKKALFLFLAGDCDDKATQMPYAPEIDRVIFNGREVGTLTGEDNLWILNTFEIPCEEINFPSSPGDIGKNELEIIIDSANSEKRWKLDIYSMALQIRHHGQFF